MPECQIDLRGLCAGVRDKTQDLGAQFVLLFDRERVGTLRAFILRALSAVA